MNEETTPTRAFYYHGPAIPRVLFVLSDDETPTIEELVRGEPLVNEDRALFEKRYLQPLGIEREQVGVMWCSSADAQPFVDALKRFDKSVPIVALGNVLPHGQNKPLAEQDAGSRPCVHLDAFVRDGRTWKASFGEEIARKMKALGKILAKHAPSVSSSLRPLRKAARLQDSGDGIATTSQRVRLYKADAPQRIVYGVVLDPYQVDLQGDWIPPADVRDTAHDFVAKHGYISYQHEGIADAQMVESFVEGYPSDDDYDKAMAGEPHRVLRRKYGGDYVHSGSWVMGVKLSPALWEQYEKGEIDAFSIEGFGTREEVDDAAMPAVKFVDVTYAGA